MGSGGLLPQSANQTGSPLNASPQLLNQWEMLLEDVGRHHKEVKWSRPSEQLNYLCSQNVGQLQTENRCVSNEQKCPGGMVVF